MTSINKNGSKKKVAALEEAAKLFGIQVDTEIAEETPIEIIREADSVMMYFDLQGKGFKKIECRNCHRIFAYSYTSDSIKCCSIECYKAVFRKIGLTWDPDAPLERRWGRVAPAIVPPAALEILDSIVESEQQEVQSTVETDDLFNLIKSLNV